MKLFTLTLIMFISVIAFGSVTSSFACSATRGCSPLVVTLTDRSSSNTTSWLWNLGNGNTSTQRNPSATYVTPGTYTVKLIVSDGTHRDSITQVITVNPKPSIDFLTSLVSVCPYDSIAFRPILTPGDAPIAKYAWGYGNGMGSDSMNASYRYPLAGTYGITLVVKDTNGCTASRTRAALITVHPNPVAAFSATPVISCATSQLVTFTDQSQGTHLSYALNFGDSTFSSVAGTVHSYSYGKFKPRLTVTDSFGCISSVQSSVSVANIVAGFRADKTRICAGEEVHFTHTSPMAGALWLWRFGDGATSGVQNAKHIYTTPGVYTVSFVIKDGTCGDTITKVAYITVTAGFSVSVVPDNSKSCTVPFAVNFTSVTTASSPVSYAWTLGNGDRDSTANTSTVYTTPGVFNVSLIVIDSSGCTVSVSYPGLITTARPRVAFGSDTLACPGAQIGFYNVIPRMARYRWDFGDGVTSSAIVPSHRYGNSGFYDVSLMVVDSNGCDTTLRKPRLIHVASADVDFSVSQTFSLCPPLVTSFTSITQRNDLRLRWDFGDGTTDTMPNPTHIFFNPGVYTIKLIGSSSQGCSDTIIRQNMITVQGPTGHFAVTSTNGCVPLTVNFTGTASTNTERIACDLGNGILVEDSANFSYVYTSARTYHPKFILTDHVGCSIPFDVDSIVAHTSPELHLRDTSVCIGQSVQMSLGTDQYSWTATACDTCGRVPSTTDTVAVATLTPTVYTTYNVIASNTGGCSTTGQFHIAIRPIEILSPRDTITLCRGEYTRFAPAHGDSIIWSPNVGLSSLTDSAPTCRPQFTLGYNVLAFDEHGCGTSQSVPVRLLEKVTAIISPDTTVCPGNSARLWVTAIDTSMKGVSYQWSPVASVDHSTASNVTVQMQAQDQTYQVITSSGSCTADTSSVIVHVRSSASVRLPDMITTVTMAEVQLRIKSGDLTTYQWTAPGTLSCADCQEPTLVPAETQVVHLTGTNQYGCPASDSMVIHVLQCDPEAIFVPNTFTPNNDGLHDVLYLHSRTLTVLDAFRVYDRWGAIVFETRDLTGGWDGIINGTPATQGVYLYTIKGKCDNGYDVEKNGTITLVR